MHVTMHIDDRAVPTIDKMCGIGFGIAQIYGDGAVRMTQIGGKVQVFVRADGTATYPHTTETQTIAASMHDMGIEYNSGRYQ